MRPPVNSLDAVSDRDFALDLLYACATLGVHLSRLGEEWVLWTSAEFGFATLDDAYSSGSSIMPQKKNPDAHELMRGKSGRLIGDLNSLLVTLKGLPLGYAKDLQEDKEPIFDAVDTVSAMLAVLPQTLRTATFHPERMRGPQEGSPSPPSSPTTWPPTAYRSGKRIAPSESSCAAASRAALLWKRPRTRISPRPIPSWRACRARFSPRTAASRTRGRSLPPRQGRWRGNWRRPGSFLVVTK